MQGLKTINAWVQMRVPLYNLKTLDMYNRYLKFIYQTITNDPLVYKVLQTKFEPRYEISNNVVCATSKGSDQTAHMHSLIRAFTGRLNIL